MRAVSFWAVSKLETLNQLDKICGLKQNKTLNYDKFIKIICLMNKIFNLYINYYNNMKILMCYGYLHFNLFKRMLFSFFTIIYCSPFFKGKRQNSYIIVINFKDVFIKNNLALKSLRIVIDF